MLMEIILKTIAEIYHPKKPETLEFRPNLRDHLDQIVHFLDDGPEVHRS